jgi:ABC-type phosphate transport system substrate-binding protein
MHSISRIMIALGLVFTAAWHEAHADVVVIVSADSPTTTLSAAQISRIFQGKSNLLTPVDIQGHSVSRREFYSKVVGVNEARVREVWSKLLFTGKGSAPREYASGVDVVKAVAADKKTIGYVDRSFVNMTVKIIYTVK